MMGLPHEYRLPAGAIRALHVIGDGVAAPVVSWLRAYRLDPLVQAKPAMAAE